MRHTLRAFAGLKGMHALLWIVQEGHRGSVTVASECVVLNATTVRFPWQVGNAPDVTH